MIIPFMNLKEITHTHTKFNEHFERNDLELAISRNKKLLHVRKKITVIE